MVVLVVLGVELERRMIRGIGYLGYLGSSSSEGELDREWLQMYIQRWVVVEKGKSKGKSDRTAESLLLGVVRDREGGYSIDSTSYPSCRCR